MKNEVAPLGILGDGQLALMLGESAEAQGFDFLGYGQDVESSFARRFPDRFILGKAGDATALIEFAKKCSVLTLENEFISARLLQQIETESGTPIIPGSKDYRYFESKISQRTFYDSLHIDSPKWAEAASTKSEVAAQLQNLFSLPLVFKSSQGGYDGYGVRIVQDENQLERALTDLKFQEGAKLLIEEKVKIKMELAQGALFDGKGSAILLPLVETIQKNGICEVVLSRPRLNPALHKVVLLKIEEILQKIAASRICGLYNFEFFLTNKDRILINEGAPRPHNSQHITIDASPISQFDLLIQFLATRQLPNAPSPVPVNAGAMINLLGKTTGTEYLLTLPALPLAIEAFPKLYLKRESRVGRKMGHLNLIDVTESQDLVKISEQILKEYKL